MRPCPGIQRTAGSAACSTESKGSPVWLFCWCWRWLSNFTSTGKIASCSTTPTCTAGMPPTFDMVGVSRGMLGGHTPSGLPVFHGSWSSWRAVSSCNESHVCRQRIHHLDELFLKLHADLRGVDKHQRRRFRVRPKRYTETPCSGRS